MDPQSMRDEHDDFAALSRILEQRYSCRAFKAAPIPRETIDAMLTAAQRTASWCNAQSWQVLLLEGAALKRFAAALYDHACNGGPVVPDFAFPSAYEGKYRDRRRECGFALYESIGIGRDDREASKLRMLENFRFFTAPHAAIIMTDAKLGPYAAVDCGGYVANFLDAAQSLGVGAVPQAAIASHPDFIRRHFGLDDSQRIVCAISFGFADTQHPINSFRTTRAGIQQVVRWIAE